MQWLSLLWYQHPSSYCLRLLNSFKWIFFFSSLDIIKYLRLHSCGREGSCCWFSGYHSPPPLINRLVRYPESGRPAPILPGTVSRRAVGPAGGLSWLQISGVINTIAIKYLWWCRARSCPHVCSGRIKRPTGTQWQHRLQQTSLDLTP